MAYYGIDKDGVQVYNGTAVTIPGNIDPVKQYLVKKVNPKKFVIEDSAGNSYTIGHAGVRCVQGAVTVLKAAKPDTSHLLPGMAVRFTTPRSVTRFPGVYVIAETRADNKAKFVKLGGSTSWVNGSLLGVEAVAEINEASWR